MMRMSARTGERIAKWVIWLAAFFVMAVLLFIMIYILVKGLPIISWSFLTEIPRSMGREGGIASTIVGTLLVTLVAIVIAVPFGIGTAFYLAEYTRENLVTRVIRFSAETLAGIPSIVYGIFGYIVFVVLLFNTRTILGGGITLAIMILPVIVRSTEESLLAVPLTLREGAFALGSSKVRTIFSVVLPCAMSGIVTSLILAVGRVMSESAVLILTVGMVVNKMPKDFMSPGTSLALNVYYFGSHDYPEQAAATGVVLLVLVVSINMLATFLGKVFGKGELANG